MLRVIKYFGKSLNVIRNDTGHMSLLVFHCNYVSYTVSEVCVWGHLRSLKVAPLESVGTVYYSHFVATTTDSLVICEIFSVKEWHGLEN